MGINSERICKNCGCPSTGQQNPEKKNKIVFNPKTSFNVLFFFLSLSQRQLSELDKMAISQHYILDAKVIIAT